MTLKQVSIAREKLQRMGLWEVSCSASPNPEKKPVSLPAEELPEYTADDIARAKASDPAFSAIQSRYEEITGRIPSRHDLSRLLGLYNHLGLSPEVIYVLFSFCKAMSKGPAGSERPPTMNYIEKVAYSWVNSGIDTAEAAESYVEEQIALFSKLGRLQKILEIYDRKLTSDERNYLTSWLSMGFDEAAISLAYERTLNNTGKRAMAYMNKIILSWNEKGLKSVSEIEAADAPPSKKTSGRKGPQHGYEEFDFDPERIDNL